MSEIVVTKTMNGDLNVTETLEGQMDITGVRYIDRAEFIDVVEEAVEEIGIDYQAQINALDEQVEINTNAIADKVDYDILDPKQESVETTIIAEIEVGGYNYSGNTAGQKNTRTDSVCTVGLYDIDADTIKIYSYGKNLRILYYNENSEWLESRSAGTEPYVVENVSNASKFAFYSSSTSDPSSVFTIVKTVGTGGYNYEFNNLVFKNGYHAFVDKIDVDTYHQLVLASTENTFNIVAIKPLSNVKEEATLCLSLGGKAFVDLSCLNYGNNDEYKRFAIVSQSRGGSTVPSICFFFNNGSNLEKTIEIKPYSRQMVFKEEGIYIKNRTTNDWKTVDLYDVLMDSDVPDWAKQSTKPTYTASEVGLDKVDNTPDAEKSVLYAETSGGVTGSVKVVVSDTAPSDTSAVWIS